MPCWEVNLMTVEFQARNINLLEEAIKSLGLAYHRSSKIINVSSNLTIDLENQTATTNSSNANLINRIKREYSTKVLEKVAKRKRWVMKKQNATVGTLRRY